MKYTIHTTPGHANYLAENYCANIWLDSDYNIFPSAAACAKFHGVSPSTVTNDWFKSKTQNKLVAVVCPDTGKYDKFIPLLDGKHDAELEKILGKYDELFENYLLKKVHATFNQKGEIILAWKTAFGFWTYEDPKDVPYWVTGKIPSLKDLLK